MLDGESGAGHQAGKTWTDREAYLLFCAENWGSPVVDCTRLSPVFFPDSNGYYIYKGDTKEQLSMDQVKDEIRSTFQRERLTSR